MMNASSVAILRSRDFVAVDWSVPSRPSAAVLVAARPMAPDNIPRAVRRSMKAPFSACSLLQQRTCLGRREPREPGMQGMRHAVTPSGLVALAVYHERGAHLQLRFGCLAACRST